MLPADFFVTDVDSSGFGGTQLREKFCTEAMQELRRAELSQYTDLEAAAALLDLVHDELTAFGTAGGERLSDADLALALTALRAVLRRVGIDDARRRPA